MNRSTPGAATFPNEPDSPVEPAPSSGTRLLVEIIELKWLLAGHGIRLHVEHLQSDHEYARRVLAQAMATSNPALRMAAERLRLGLGLAEG